MSVKKELTVVQTDHEIYYAYINEKDEIEIGCMGNPQYRLVLGEGSARSHYDHLSLQCWQGQLILFYTCYEPMRNGYLMVALYPFPVRQEEILYFSPRGRIFYDTFVIETACYVGLRGEEERRKGELMVFQKRDRGFERMREIEKQGDK